MTTINARINLKTATLAQRNAVTEDGTPLIISDSGAYPFAFEYRAGGTWRVLQQWNLTLDSISDAAATAYGIGLLEKTAGDVLTYLGISSTENVLPKGNGSGGLVASCFSDDGSTAAISRPLNLNGATRPAWVVNLASTIQLSDAVALGVYSDVGSDGADLWTNLSYSSGYTAINGKAGNLPTRLSISQGAIALLSSITQPTAGGTVSDMTVKWSVDRFGRQIQWGNAEPVASAMRPCPGSLVTVTNTTTEISILGGAYTIPAQRLGNVGALLGTENKCFISCLNAATLVVRVKVGGTTIATGTFTAPAALTNANFRIVTDLQTKSVGTGGTVSFYGAIHSQKQNAQDSPIVVQLTPTSFSTLALNTTIANTYNVTVQWGAASASNSITCVVDKQIGN